MVSASQVEPYITIRAVRPLVSGLQALGHDPAPLLASAGIERAALNDPDAQVPWAAVLTLIARAVDRTGDTNLGLHLAEHADLGPPDVHIYATVSSPTLRDAYERLCRYQRLIHETTRVELAEQGDWATLRHVMPGGMAAPRQSAEFLLTLWVRGSRLAVGQEWTLTEVHFGDPVPPDPSEHHRFFGAPVRFGSGENALLLPAALRTHHARGPTRHYSRGWTGTRQIGSNALLRRPASRTAPAPRYLRACAAASPAPSGWPPAGRRACAR